SRSLLVHSEAKRIRATQSQGLNVTGAVGQRHITKTSQALGVRNQEFSSQDRRLIGGSAAVGDLIESHVLPTLAGSPQIDGIVAIWKGASVIQPIARLHTGNDIIGHVFSANGAVRSGSIESPSFGALNCAHA